MFLRCSYFFGNLSLNVLINMVLTQKKECFCFFISLTEVIAREILISFVPSMSMEGKEVVKNDFCPSVSIGWGWGKDNHQNGQKRSQIKN